jgi:hypothetical protein
MAIKKVPKKNGRPKGSGNAELTHIARIPMKPETWQALGKAAAREERSASDIVREQVDKYLKGYR